MNPLSHSTHLVIFVLSLFYMIPTSDTYSLYVPTYDEKSDFYIVIIITITFNITNLLGSLYIFYRTFFLWKRNDGLLSLRLPFYIAITDFFASTTTLLNFSYSASNKTKLLKGEAITWPSPYCEAIGFFNTSFILLNMLLIGAISFTTWLRVVKEYYFEWGKYDYKIWSPIVFISFFIPLTSIHDFDAQKYWCGIRYNAIELAVMCSIVIVLTLLIVVICYLHVLKIIYDVNEDVSSATNSQIDSVQRINIEKKSLKKVLAYILVFILQYIPIVIFNVCKILKVQHVIIYVLSPSAVSIGGMGNLIQFIYNEGLIFRPSNLEKNRQQPSSSTTDTSEKTM